jgi:predicted nucleic acid-binding protein
VTGTASSPFLLDTSALLALIEDEPGADRVESLLRTATVLIPALAGLEVYYVTHQERGEDDADRRLSLLRQLPAEWLDQLTDPVLIAAGRIKAAHRLSLADAIIAGFALSRDATLVHKDPEYDAIAHLVRQERLPYKASAKRRAPR